MKIKKSEKKLEKRTWKIGKFTFWTDEWYMYTIHGQNLDDPKNGKGKRSRNMYRWNPKEYDTYRCGNHNIEDASAEIVMRAFVILYPDVKEYMEYYNSMYGCKNLKEKETNTTVVNNDVNATNTVTNNATVDILIKALRQQAKMLEESLQKQAEMNNAHVEEIINIVTATSNTVVTDSNTNVDATTDSTNTIVDSTTATDNTTTATDNTTTATDNTTTVNDATNTVGHNTAVQEEPKKQSLPNTIEATIDDDDDEEVE